MTHATCACGAVSLALSGTPIFAVECCCTSCRTANAAFEALPGAEPVLTPHGATPYTVFRKDRVAPTAGTEHLVAHRLSPEAHTRRVIATCCNQPMYLEFEAGHWLSIYTARIPEADRTPISLRTMTGDLPDPSVLPSDVPNPRTHTVGFMARLFAAWVAMGFRVPAVDWPSEAPSEA